ncbi:hypothetical protein HELRODRAFT_176378 [Helobdella robusta]|uniref:Protein rolling stone n=1 Tax=Helobdella robusta TaxID=6412 RepID=T1FAG5_HELRO|nr:hypothetical protein HELRODRAFT_176378 [Helobdella robusta]ESO00068.1 hypothetical protein HELRODRAFT_176378 [Helobdella robusta]
MNENDKESNKNGSGSQKSRSVSTSIGKDCCTWFKNEVNLKNILPIHNDPMVMVNSQPTYTNKPPTQWSSGKISAWYVSYRIVVAIVVVVWLPVDCYYETQKYFQLHYELWFTYATNWSIMFLAISNVLFAITTARFYSKQKEGEVSFVEGGEASFDLSLSIQWVIYNAAANGSIVITVSYWAFIIFVDKSIILSHVKHTLNTAFIIADLFISSTPIRLLHFIYPIFVGVIYSTFYVIYFCNGGVGPRGKPYVYEVLRWDEKPGLSTLVTILVLMLVGMAQFFLYSLYRLRMTLYEHFQSRKKAKEVDGFGEVYQQVGNNNCSGVESCGAGKISELDSETKNVVSSTTSTKSYQTIWRQ